MIPHTGALFANLSEEYDRQSQVPSTIPDDDEFMRMMNMGSASNNDIRRLESSSSCMNTSETICASSTSTSVGNEVPTGVRVSVNETEEQNKPSKKRKQRTRNSRGQNKPKFGLHGVETILFNAKGQPVAPNDKVAQLGRFIGQLVKECADFPLNAKNWIEICQSGKVSQAWKTVEDALDWSDPTTLALKDKIIDVIVEKLHDRWKSFKHKMKKKWYDPFKGMETRFTCGNKHVHAGQWRALVMRWDETKIQEVAQINVTNRQQLKLRQTTGSKTYAQLRYQWECEHPGEVLDRVTFFHLVHSSSNKGSSNSHPSNEEAKKKKDELKELESDVRNEGREITPEVRNELFHKVMGPEKRNRVRGYGCGVKWADVPGIVTQKNGMKHQLLALSEASEAQRVAAEKREIALSQKLQESAEREEALKDSLGLVKKKLDSLEAQVSSNPLIQMFTAAGINSMESLDISRLINFLKKDDNCPASSHSNDQAAHNSNRSGSTC